MEYAVINWTSQVDCDTKHSVTIKILRSLCVDLVINGSR